MTAITFNTETYVHNLDQRIVSEFDYRRVLDSAERDRTVWLTWQARFRQRLGALTGYAHVQTATTELPLSPRTVEKAEYEDYTLEKSYITTEPGIEIPFYLLLPKHHKGPFPLVLTPHGHGRRGKEVYVGRYEDDEECSKSQTGERDVALQAVMEGYAAIAMDVRGFWEMAREEEVAKEKNNSCMELQKNAMMFGRTIIGERVHDMSRLIDYAVTRDEIDTRNVIITGNSGGGTVSLFAAALEERITMSIPSSYFCTFHESIMAIHHCICNVVPGMLTLGEMYDVAGLIAPRPALFVTGEHDPIFPVEATKEAFAHVRRIYASMGVPEHCDLYIGAEGHRYYKKPVWPFVRQHLIRV